MKIEVFKPRDLLSPYRCAIQYYGRLGFTSMAIISLDLERIYPGGSIAIGKNAEDPAAPSFYMQVYNISFRDAFRICKTGNYYYLNTKALFDKLGFDYKNKNIFFNIERLSKEESVTLYRLHKQEVTRTRFYYK